MTRKDDTYTNERVKTSLFERDWWDKSWTDTR